MGELQTNRQQSNQAVPVKTWSEAVIVDEEQRRKEQESRAKWFARLFVPSMVYAASYTVFTYQNSIGLGIFAWIFATALYALYLMRTSGLRLKKGSGFLLALMGLLGISTLLTANRWLIFCNKCGFCLLLLYFLLTQTKNSDDWSILEMLKSMAFAVFGAIGKVWTPFAEGYSWIYTHIQKQGGRHDDEQVKKQHMALLGIIITIPVLLFLGSLLMSADAVFKNMMGYFTFTWVPEIHVDVFGICCSFLFGLLASYCGMHYILESSGERVEAAQTKYPAMIAQIVISSVLVLYVWFCLVQIIYLFGGFGTLPKGMTYAQYARAGFFQLLFVCILNVFLVLSVKRFFEDVSYLRYVLLGICLCSYVMTASSAYRMILYVQAYHLTVLRVVVLVALGTIAVLLAGVAASVFNEKFRILPYFVTVISIVYTLFSFSNAERFVVQYDLAHMTEDNADGIFEYMSRLSLDALPEAISFLEQEDDGYAKEVCEKLQITCQACDVQPGEQLFDYLRPDDETYGWLVRWLGYNRKLLSDDSLMSWNLSSWHAKAALQGFMKHLRTA